MAYRNPYTKKDLADIDAGLNSLADAQQLIDRAQEAGMDVAAKAVDCQMCRDTLTNIKKIFFSLKAGDQ